MELASPAAANNLDNHNYVLWVMLNPSKGGVQRLDDTIRKVIDYTFGQGANVGAFRALPQIRNIQGLKIVNLYSQPLPNPNELDPNDRKGEGYDLQNNPVQNKIQQCQDDNNCQAIVAAWGGIPNQVFVDENEWLHDETGTLPFILNDTQRRTLRRRNENLIIARMNTIANFINRISNKGGYVGSLTGRDGDDRRYPRHPKTNDPNAQFTFRHIRANNPMV